MSVSPVEDFLHENELNLWLLVQTTNSVLARTIRTGPPPDAWSDSELATQTIELVLEEALCGTPRAAGMLELDVPIVEGSRTAGSTPRIADWLGRRGARAVIFLEDGQLADEDLGAMEATEATVNWIRAACGGPIPPGTPSILYLLSVAAHEDAAVAKAFSGIESGVVDLHDLGGAVARLTIAHGEVRVFSGIRAARVTKMRDPDLVLFVSAPELVALLFDSAPREPQGQDDDEPLLRALRAAGEAVSRDVVRGKAIEEAANA